MCLKRRFLLTTNPENACEEATNAKAKLHGLCAAAESIAEENHATLIKVREERHGEPSSLRTAASEREAPIAEVRGGRWLK